MQTCDMDNREEPEEFIFHHGDDTLEPEPNKLSWLIETCEKYRDEILETTLRKTANQICDICHHSYIAKLETERCGMVFPVRFRVNQEKNANFFKDLLVDEFKNRSMNWLPAVKIIVLEEQEITDLILKMFVDIEEIVERGKKSCTIFIAEKITNLTFKNIGLFERALQGRHYVAVLPTFVNLNSEQDYDSYGRKYEKFYIQLYNNRDLFCEFMYRCLESKEVKAYLPPGVLRIVSDFDYYPISFQEGVRRFMYCLEEFYSRIKGQIVYVESLPLVDIIEDVLLKYFTRKNFYFEEKKNYYQLLRCILDPKEPYVISSGCIYFIEKFQKFTETEIISLLRDNLEKTFQKHPQLEQYISYLHENPMEKKYVLARRKPRREDGFGITNKVSLTEKIKVENQITAIIKDLTKEVRRQACGVRWEDIKYQLRIQPEIPRLIVEGIQKSPQHNELLDAVTSWSSVPLVRLAIDFGTENIGRLMYLLRDLEICGVININRKMIKPIITTNFFQKANFSKRK